MEELFSPKRTILLKQEKMKESLYNVFVNDGDNLYCFNSLTKNFFSIKIEQKKCLNKYYSSQIKISNKNYLLFIIY